MIELKRALEDLGQAICKALPTVPPWALVLACVGGLVVSAAIVVAAVLEWVEVLGR